jgi:hypothetical protein
MADVRFQIPPGTVAATCRGCSARVYWIVTTGGRRMPVNPDGVSHFATCPSAGDFRKKKT